MQSNELHGQNVYGATGNKWFPYFDLRVAESITSTGQVAIRYIGNRINTYLNTLLKTTDLDYIAYEDTDSAYVNLERLVIKLGIQDKDEDYIVEALNDICKKKLEPFIDQCYRELAEQMNAHSHNLFMKREAISPAGVWCLHPETTVNGVPIKELYCTRTAAYQVNEVSVKDISLGTMSFNVDKQYIELDLITAVMRKHYVGDMYTIEAGNKKIKVTADHLMLCLDAKGLAKVWKKAKNLALDDSLLSNDSSVLPINGISHEHYDGFVYDVTVRKNHNLFADGILVHNCGKKRYALHVRDNEGVRYDKRKLKYVGLEAKRSNVPEVCRGWLEHCYDLALREKKEDLHKYVVQCQKEYSTFSPEDVASVSTANNIAKFCQSGFIAAKGTPKHIKAVINHNKLASEDKTRALKAITEGEKVMLVEMDPRKNKHGFEVLAFVGYFPRGRNLEQAIDYGVMFNKNFIEPLKNFLSAIGWEHEKVNTVDDFFA